MSELDWLAGRFEENRDRLRGVAYRMLGSAAEADDAVRKPGCGSAAPTRAAWRTCPAG